MLINLLLFHIKLLSFQHQKKNESSALRLVLINRKKEQNKAILELSNHPSRNRFVLSQYRRFL